MVTWEKQCRTHHTNILGKRYWRNENEPLGDQNAWGKEIEDKSYRGKCSSAQEKKQRRCEVRV